MALEARGFSRPGRRTLLWWPARQHPGSARALGLLRGARCADRRARGGAAGLMLRLDVGQLPLRRGAAAVAARRLAWRWRDGEVLGLVGRVRGRQDDPLPGRFRPGAARRRRHAARPRPARWRATWPAAPMHAAGRAGRRSGFRTRDAAYRGGRHGLRGGRVRADEPGAAARRAHRAHLGRARGPAHRGARRARPGAPVGRTAAAGGDRRPARPCAPSTSSWTSRPPSSTRPARSWWPRRWPAWPPTAPASSSPSTRPTCWPRSRPRRRDRRRPRRARRSRRARCSPIRGCAELGVRRAGVRLRLRAAGRGRPDVAARRRTAIALTGGARMIELELRSALVHVVPEGGVRALDGVDLRIGPGERVALVGQNGSRQDHAGPAPQRPAAPDRAAASCIGGARCRRLTVAQLARQVGLVFQDPGPPDLRRQRPRGGASSARATWACAAPSCATRSSAALAAVGLADSRDANPYDLGGSRRKLLALASVLAMRTPVLVLDEPTTGQDVARRGRGARGGRAARRGGAHRHRHQPRHGVRGGDVRPGGRAARGARHPGRPAGDRSSRAESWEALRSTYLEPPLAAIVGERLGLGSTPTDAALIAALARERRRPQ